MECDVNSGPGPVTAAAALFGTWRVGSPQRQRDAAQAIADAWQARPWPGTGLRSYSVLAADDGATMLNFGQVDDPADVPAHDPIWKQEVDAAVPGIERLGVVAGKLRQSSPAYGPAAEAACIVLVTRVFDGPDIERASRLVDAMFEGSADTPPADGLLSANFYVSTDGAKVFNYALWTSAEAHEKAIEQRPAQLEANEQWQQAHAWPGLVSTTFQRFSPLLRLTAAASR